jgi:hypothetical protein
MAKKSVLITASVLGVACLAAALIVFHSGAIPWFRGDLPNCLLLEDSNARLEVHYPDQFIGGGSGDIRIQERDPVDPNQPAQGDFIFGVTVGVYEPLSWLINPHSQGPKYSSSTFNGRAAAFYLLPPAGGNIWYDYVIPVGEDVFEVDYRFSQLTPDEQDLVRKMVNSVSITQTTEEVQPTRVTQC